MEIDENVKTAWTLGDWSSDLTFHLTLGGLCELHHFISFCKGHELQLASPAACQALS